ncbi:MAG: hypothetical protein P1U89_20850 [Verrucomicrobiales bacterium]|nr:hypothetical protein [Verrucomicrobiales bacterium]
MKKTILLAAFAGFSISLTSSYAGEPIITCDKEVIEVCEDEFDTHRVDSHAPIGVMGDHTHEAGEVMVSYRYHHMSMGGSREGTNSLSIPQVFQRGYGVGVKEMEGHMHMLGFMYAPSDWLTLTTMINYVQKDMVMVANPHAMHHGGHGGGHTGTFGHSSEGLGDITVGGLIKIYDANRQRVHLNLGLVLPTAEVDQMEGGTFLPYGMQAGSGTFDLQPGITYLGQSDAFSWGAQAIARIPLEDENESGYSLGDSVNITTWLARPLTDNLSISARLNYNFSDALEGHYNGPHAHAAPPHFQANYGGHVIEASPGINLLLNNGYRLAVEGLIPVYQDANGVGMDRDFGVVAGLQKAF